MMAGIDPVDWLVALSAVSALVSFVAAAVAIAGGATRRRFKRRLGMVHDRAKGIPVSSQAARLTRAQSATPNIDRVARRWLPRRDLLAARLARTGKTITIGQYALATGAIAIVVLIGLIALTPLGIVPCALLGLSVGMAIPHLMVSRIGGRRVAAFTALFPDAIDLMVRALRSGLPISEAIVGAGHEIADPVGSELRLVESGMRLGRDLEALLWDIAKRIDTPEFRFFIIALGVQRETGGNLAETLANLADALRRRRQMRAKVKAMSSETRATTMILGGLPVVVIGLLMLTSPSYLKPLFHDVRGFVLDGVAMAMLVTGIAIMNRMARFEI